MRYVFVGSQGLQSWQFRLHGVCVAELSIKDWPYDEDARRRVAAVVITLLNETPEITHVVAGVFNEQGQICAAHATHDLVMLSPMLHRRADDLIFQVVKVQVVDCACFDDQPAAAGAFTCGLLQIQAARQPQTFALTPADLQGA